MKTETLNMGARRLAAACLGLAVVLAAVKTSAQQGPSVSERSYQRARQVLDRGVQALGGMEAISAIRNFTVAEVGKGFRMGLPNPEPAFDEYDWEETTVVDFSGARLSHDVKAWDQRTIIDGNQGFLLVPSSKSAWTLRAPSLENNRELFQKLPHFLLRDALAERAASLRWLGEAEAQGGKQQVVTFADRDGQQLALFFDARTHLLTKYEALYTDSVYGDTVREFIFSGYRGAGRLQVPTGLTERIAGRVAQHVRYERVEINSPLADSLFSVPEGYEKVPLSSSAPTQPYTMTMIADDVYLIQGVSYGGNVLVVAFDDFVLVAEAPETRAYSRANEQVIAKIRETIPGKPIRYHVFSHYHDDHSAGARAYIAEGATIVTTPGNEQFVERLAAAPFAMNPDALARRPRRPVVEIIRNRKHVIRDAKHVVELYDIGPYPHAKEELIVYLPQHKLLFEGDLYASGFRDYVPAANDTTLMLAEKIKELGLDVEQIAGVHGRLRPIGDLHKALEKRNRTTMR